MKKAHAAIIALAALALVAGLAAVADRGGSARADDSSMAAMSIDMNVTGNTATALGALDSCAHLIPNGTMDGDETAVDTLTFDVTATGIPPAAPMTGFAFRILYDDTDLAIQTADANFLLNSLAGSSLFNGDDPVPDTTQNGRWSANQLDTAFPQGPSAETGSGVLERLTIKAQGTPADGLYDLTLSPDDAGHVTEDNAGHVPNALNDARIAVGSFDCSSTPAPTPTPAPFKKGDVDCNGDVSSVDALKDLRFVAGLSITQQPGCPAIAQWGDMDCSGDVTAVDALRILRFVAGLQNTLPQGCAPLGV